MFLSHLMLSLYLERAIFFFFFALDELDQIMFGLTEMNSKEGRKEGRGQYAMATHLHCYLVQKTQWNAVFHPAKLASGANYPVGWVQMPHSAGGEVRGWGLERWWERGIRQGQKRKKKTLKQVLTPRCAILLLPAGVRAYGAKTFLTWS